MESGGWMMEDGGWMMEGGGWVMEGGGWRVFPRQQISDISYAKDNDQALLGHLLLVARTMAEQQHLQDGHRLGH
ncbi:hypothetical protein BV898_11832 [Hypsibius exemplaris]|uniref:Uncharacterized protein n=1 Tax=Hypsibius exemplaris TaxID=2072580 RepID=A0A1W0WFF6_HYPEX|nr:hypothetical protein BV898_11832 [Hypsibius exemplaris]